MKQVGCLRKAETDIGKNVMIALFKSRVPDRITDVADRTFGRSEINSDGRISCIVFARDPIRRRAETIVDRLFDTEHSARTARVFGNNIFRKPITSGRDARSRFGEGFCRLDIKLVAEIEGFVSDGNKNIVADRNGHAVFFISVKTIFEHRRNRRRVRTGLNVAEHRHTDLEITRHAVSDTRQKARETAVFALIVRFEKRAEFEISFALGKRFGRQNVKLCISRENEKCNYKENRKNELKSSKGRFVFHCCLTRSNG